MPFSNIFRETSEGDTLWKVQKCDFVQTVISLLGKELLEVASLRILVNDFEKHLEGSMLDQEDVWLPNPCLM